MVFFESPHRLADALADAAAAFGRRPAGRRLPRADQDLRGDPPRAAGRAGDVGRRGRARARSRWSSAGRRERAVSSWTPAALAAAVAAEEAAGATRKDAIRAVVVRTGLPRRTVYDAVVAAKTP